MQPLRREAFFLPGAAHGGRFCLLTRAPEPVGSLVFVHAFAEEMNKSRRMVALAARAFAERGWNVLQMDLSGCGDSGGELANVSWGTWIDDLRDAVRWATTDLRVPVALWGMRLGALVVSDWIKADGTAPPLLLWQPVGNGKQHLTQFLRLKAAFDMLADADAKASMDAIRATLKAGGVVDVAGYRLPAALASGMEAATLSLPAAYAAPVVALEVAPADRQEVSPALRGPVDRWANAGTAARAAVVPGVAFWQTQEIEVCEPLIEASVEALKGFVR